MAETSRPLSVGDRSSIAEQIKVHSHLYMAYPSPVGRGTAYGQV